MYESLIDMQESSEFRTGEQYSEKDTPGLKSVLDPDGFGRQEERQVQAAIPLGHRERGEAARVRQSGLGFGLLLVGLRQFCLYVRALGFRNGLRQGFGFLPFTLGRLL